MFKIEPVQDKSRQKELCQLFDVEFKEDYFAYYMYDVDTLEPMGMSQFEIRGESGYISEIVPWKNTDDREAMFILGRQTMNFIDLCGAHICYASKRAADARLLSAIGFSPANDDLFCDMTNMFSGHCDGHSAHEKL